MNIKEMIDEIWSDPEIRAAKITKKQIKLVVKIFSEKIVDSLVEHGKVKLRNLFSLELSGRKGRKIRNPQTGETMYSQDSVVVRVTPSKYLRDVLVELREDTDE